MGGGRSNVPGESKALDRITPLPAACAPKACVFGKLTATNAREPRAPTARAHRKHCHSRTIQASLVTCSGCVVLDAMSRLTSELRFQYTTP